MKEPMDALAAACAHALARWPEEACGVVVRPPGAPPRFVAVENVAADRRRRFELDPAAQLDLWSKAAAGAFALEAIVHSHPCGSTEFSQEDRASATYAGGALHPGLAWWVIGIEGPPPRATGARAWVFDGGEWTSIPLAGPAGGGGGLLRLL